MKIKFKHRADNYFWVTALLIFIVGLFQFMLADEKMMLINIYDTYYVVNKFHFALFCTQLYFLIGAIYWLLYKSKRNINPKLTKLHAKVTTGIVFIYLIALPIVNYLDSGMISKGYANMLLVVVIAIFVLAQPLLLANIISGLVKGRVTN